MFKKDSNSWGDQESVTWCATSPTCVNGVGSLNKFISGSLVILVCSMLFVVMGCCHDNHDQTVNYSVIPYQTVALSDTDNQGSADYRSPARVFIILCLMFCRSLHLQWCLWTWMAPEKRNWLGCTEQWHHGPSQYWAALSLEVRECCMSLYTIISLLFLISNCWWTDMNTRR